MPLTRYINGIAFEPEALRHISAAFESACDALGLVDRNDPLVEIVAKQVISIAMTGERDIDRLRQRTIEALTT
jgi:hypothetical protein